MRSLAGRLSSPVRQLRHSEKAQGLVEYALIIAIVSLGAIASLTFFKDNITGLFSKTGSNLASSTSAPPAPVITSGPAQPTTTDRTATFAYTTQFADFVECKLDNAAWSVCPDTGTPPYTGPLSVAAHQFKVRATNDFGMSPEANWDWTILGSPPPSGTPITLPSGPPFNVDVTYYYYPAGAVNGNFGNPDGLEGYYAFIALPANPPTSFTVDGWTFGPCVWHTALLGWSGPGHPILNSACVIVPVPTGGTASLAPAGPVTLGTQLTASTTGWSGSPDSYEYRWQRNNNTDCSVGPYTTWDTNNSASASNSNTPNNLSDGDRCYQVVVTASNYGGDSTPAAPTSPVLVNNPPRPSGGSVSITEGATVPLNTTIHATTAWTLGNPTSYAFAWQQGTAGAPCASATFSGNWDSDTNSTPNDTLGNTPNSLSEGDRCYRVTVTATGLGGTSQAPQPFATVFVQNPPQPPSGGSVTVSNQGGGTASGYDDGDTLRATTSGWDAHGSPITSYTYTWQREAITSTRAAAGPAPTTTLATSRDRQHTLRPPIDYPPRTKRPARRTRSGST